jgi:hypothetical protein
MMILVCDLGSENNLTSERPETTVLRSSHSSLPVESNGDENDGEGNPF